MISALTARAAGYGWHIVTRLMPLMFLIVLAHAPCASLAGPGGDGHSHGDETMSITTSASPRVSMTGETYDVVAIVNAGEILQRLAGVKVQHGRKQEGPRAPSCLSGFIPEGQRPTVVLTVLGVTGAWSERA